MSIPFAFALFFLSFAPLWLSVLFIDIISILGGEGHIWTEAISIALIAAGMLVSAVIAYYGLKRRGAENSRPFTIVSQKEEKTVTAEFLLSYILPLFTFDFTKWDEIVLFLIFFVTLAALCLRHRRFTVSAVLELAGYRFYQCELKPRGQDDAGKSEKIERMVVTRTPLTFKQGTVHLFREINNDCWLDETR